MLRQPSPRQQFIDMVAGFIVRTAYGYYTVGGRGQYWTLEEARRAWRERRRMAAEAYDRLMQRIASRFGSKPKKESMKPFLPPPKPEPEPKQKELSPPFSISMFPEPTMIWSRRPIKAKKRAVKRKKKASRKGGEKRKARKPRKTRTKPSGIVHDMLSLIL